MQSTSAQTSALIRPLGRLARMATAIVGLSALLCIGAATTQASAATPTYKTAPIYASISEGGGIARVNLQADYRFNGVDIYRVDGPYCTASGYGITVTWCGVTGGGSSNLTFGFNTNLCVGPFNIGCISGGYRVIINKAGKMVQWYTF